MLWEDYLLHFVSNHRASWSTQSGCLLDETGSTPGAQFTYSKHKWTLSLLGETSANLKQSVWNSLAFSTDHITLKTHFSWMYHPNTNITELQWTSQLFVLWKIILQPLSYFFKPLQDIILLTVGCSLQQSKHLNFNEHTSQFLNPVPI